MGIMKEVIMFFNNQGKKIFLGSLFFALASTSFFPDKARAEYPNPEVKCDKSNFRDYIGDREKTLELFEKTGIGCQLVMANLEGADLTGAYLKWANLYKANLEGADLTGAKLYKANLTEAKLTGAKLYKANLARARLYKTNLTGAKLTGADLYRANLAGAKLTGAYLKGAYLYKANLTETNLKGAIYDEHTVFPDYFDPKSSGAVEVAE